MKVKIPFDRVIEVPRCVCGEGQEAIRPRCARPRDTRRQDGLCEFCAVSPICLEVAALQSRRGSQAPSAAEGP